MYYSGQTAEGAAGTQVSTVQSVTASAWLEFSVADVQHFHFCFMYFTFVGCLCRKPAPLWKCKKLHLLGFIWNAAWKRFLLGERQACSLGHLEKMWFLIQCYLESLLVQFESVPTSHVWYFAVLTFLWEFGVCGRAENQSRTSGLKLASGQRRQRC